MEKSSCEAGVTAKMGRFAMSTNHPAAPGYYETSSGVAVSRAYYRVPGKSSYTIQKGDTLGKIAKRYGTTVSNLQSVNSIPNANEIKAGDSLIVN